MSDDREVREQIAAMKKADPNVQIMARVDTRNDPALDGLKRQAAALQGGRQFAVLRVATAGAMQGMITPVVNPKATRSVTNADGTQVQVSPPRSFSSRQAALQWCRILGNPTQGNFIVVEVLEDFDSKKHVGAAGLVNRVPADDLKSIMEDHGLTHVDEVSPDPQQPHGPGWVSPGAMFVYPDSELKDITYMKLATRLGLV